MLRFRHGVIEKGQPVALHRPLARFGDSVILLSRMAVWIGVPLSIHLPIRLPVETSPQGSLWKGAAGLVAPNFISNGAAQVPLLDCNSQ